MKGNMYVNGWQKERPSLCARACVCIKLINQLINQTPRLFLSAYYVSGTGLVLGTKGQQES